MGVLPRGKVMGRWGATLLVATALSGLVQAHPSWQSSTHRALEEVLNGVWTTEKDYSARYPWIVPIAVSQTAYDAGQARAGNRGPGKSLGSPDNKQGYWGFTTCTASIINPEWALTAAHCVVDKRPADMQLLYGRSCLTYDTNMAMCKGVSRFVELKVTEILPYRGFMHNDEKIDALFRPLREELVKLGEKENRWVLEKKGSWQEADQARVDKLERTMRFITDQLSRGNVNLQMFKNALVDIGIDSSEAGSWKNLDIALVRFTGPHGFSVTQFPLIDSTDVKEGNRVRFFGWGKSLDGLPIDDNPYKRRKWVKPEHEEKYLPSPWLVHGDLKVIDRKCRGFINEEGGFMDPVTGFCAKDPSNLVTMGTGDSGGPCIRSEASGLIFGWWRSPPTKLIGVNVQGTDFKKDHPLAGLANPEVPCGFTRVSEYVDWITTTTGYDHRPGSSFPPEKIPGFIRVLSEVLSDDTEDIADLVLSLDKDVAMFI